MCLYESPAFRRHLMDDGLTVTACAGTLGSLLRATYDAGSEWGILSLTNLGDRCNAVSVLPGGPVNENPLPSTYLERQAAYYNNGIATE